MKKILSIIICFVLLSGVCNTGVTPLNVLNIFNLTASADEETTSGQCGDNLYWSFDADTYTLTISGTGDMYDYGSEINSDFFSSVEYQNYGFNHIYMNNPTPWDMFRTQIRKIDIQPGCTSVGNFAFFRCWYVGGIIFPEGITKIGNCIFTESILSVSKVFFPSTLEHLGSHFCSGDSGHIYRPVICSGGNDEIEPNSVYNDDYHHTGLIYTNTKAFGDYILSVDEQTKTAEIVAYVGCDEYVDIPQTLGDYTITGINYLSFSYCIF